MRKIIQANSQLIIGLLRWPDFKDLSCASFKDMDVSAKSQSELDVVLHTCNPRTKEMEVGGSKF
jgi:hypothetical protein